MSSSEDDPDRTAQAEPDDRTLPPAHPVQSTVGNRSEFEPEALCTIRTVNLGPLAPLPAGTTPAASDFKLEKELGRGGMGVVFRASQASLAREVAVKMLHSEHSGNRNTERRFMGEALITAELDHPNIVPVHELARGKNGQLMVAMKLVNGKSWEEVLRTPGASSLNHQLEIFLKVCDGIAYAHSKGVVHRDLKPANVMVGAYGEVLVMDWGLALDVSDDPHRVRKTESRDRAAGLAGTPSYMAPEQARGDVHAIAFATDIYLMGGILYNVLTGTAPHRGEGVKAVLAAAVTGWIQPPRERAPDRAIPAELVEICLRALSPVPADRYDSITLLATAVREFMGHQESARLATRARERAAALSARDRVPRDERYAEYSHGLAELGEALQLWPDNDSARRVQAELLTRYATEALDRGDSGLARAQLVQMRENPHVPPAELGAVEAALAAERGMFWRSLLGLMVLVVVAWLGHDFLQMLAQEENHIVDIRRKHRGHLDHIEKGLKAAQAGDSTGGLVELLAAREMSKEPDADRGLAWTCIVADWAHGDLSHLIDTSVKAIGAAAPDVKLKVKELLKDPAIRGTALARQLEMADPNRMSTVWLWETMAAAAPVMPGPALDAALARLSANEGGGISSQLAQLCAATIQAMSRGERGAPFALSANPFGVVVNAPTGPLPEALLSGNGMWSGIARNGRVAWEAPQLLNFRSFFQPLRCPDGTLVIGGESQLLNLDGATGRVLKRIWMDGNVVAMWPDLKDPKRLCLLVTTDFQTALTRQATLENGKLIEPSADACGMLSTAALTGPQTHYATLLAERLTGHDPKRLHEAKIDEQVLAELEAAAALDATNPCVPVGLLRQLEAMRKANPSRPDLRNAAWRHARAEEATARMRTGDLPPRLMACILAYLEEFGFSDLAKPLYPSCVRAASTRGLNSDLATHWMLSPTGFIRLAGGRLFEAGEIDRALELVETGRWFSSYLEEDLLFYRRYGRWLGQGNRSRASLPHPEVNRRLAQAGAASRSLDISEPMKLATDMVLVLVLWLPLVVAFVAMRFWWRARESVRTELVARGLRTKNQQLLAFLSRPVERVCCGFLSFATRRERLGLVLIGALYLGATLVGGAMIMVIGEKTGVSGELLSGYPGQDAMLRYVEKERHHRPTEPAVLRLAAEGWFSRNDLAQAQAAIDALVSADATDAIGLNNAGVLAEMEGDRPAARAFYQKGKSPAAAWNLARLDSDTLGRAQAAARLEQRDRLYCPDVSLVPDLPSGPLWARVPFEDLGTVLFQHLSPRHRIGSVVQAMAKMNLSSPLLDLVHTAGGDLGSTGAPLLVLLYYGTLILPMLALLLLPLPVRPLVKQLELAEPDGLHRALGLLAKSSQFLLGVLLPGSWDVFRGRGFAGTLKLLVLVGAASMHVAATGHGVLMNVMGPTYNRGYFPSVPINVLGRLYHSTDQAALTIAVILYLFNFIQLFKDVWRRP